MHCRFVRYSAAVIAMGTMLAWFPKSASAQFGAPSPEAIQKAAAMPTPKAPDGHPDLTGDWGTPTVGSRGTKTPEGNIIYGAIGGGVAPAGANQPAAPPRPRPVPNVPAYKPELTAKVKELADAQVGADPGYHCKPLGVPRIGPPKQIVQAPGVIAFFYQVDSGEGDAQGITARIIRTDGRPHRTDLEDTSYFGDSIGHWEGNTLVVDVTNLNDDTWLGIQGYFHSDSLHVVERLTREGDTLRYEATVEDPNVLAKPWVMTPRTVLRTTEDVYEAPPCVEHDQGHLVNGDHHTQE